MRAHLSRAHRAAPVLLGAIALAFVAVLFTWDAFPRLLPSRAHDFLGALALASIAIAYLVYQTIRRPGARELFKALLLAIAFLFWAANQFWPKAAHATLFNDIAIGLFALDVFLVMIGWPATSPDESFAESDTKTTDRQLSGPAARENGLRLVKSG
jgi:hypothetical protein